MCACLVLHGTDQVEAPLPFSRNQSDRHTYTGSRIEKRHCLSVYCLKRFSGGDRLSACQAGCLATWQQDCVTARASGYMASMTACMRSIFITTIPPHIEYMCGAVSNSRVLRLTMRQDPHPAPSLAYCMIIRIFCCKQQIVAELQHTTAQDVFGAPLCVGGRSEGLHPQ